MKDVEKTLNDFLSDDEREKEDKTSDDFISDDEKKNVDNKQTIINEREGLIERIDRILVTKDGKQLLREQY